ncbi:MAG: hypothetical protein GY859_09250 [Desulfobacterales bacterium]|nr:hypothetical protein [Desulfobacterales bacterium]
MSSLKMKIEQSFERFGYLVCRNRIKTVILMFLFIGLLVSQLPKTTIDTSFEGILHEKDPARIQYNEFRDDFGQDRIIIATVETPDVFTEKTLKRLMSMHTDFENRIPHLDEVNSLINARRTTGEGDTLIVGELLEGWPERPVDLDALREFVLNNPVYLNDCISEDGRVAAFIIRPRAAVEKTGLQDAIDQFDEEPPAAETGPGAVKSAKRHYLSKRENREVMNAVNAITARWDAPDFKIALAGGPVSETVYDKLPTNSFSNQLILQY